MSTPATASPMTLAARKAVMRSSGVILIRLALPPRCRLERNSPGLAWRFIAAITLSPTTKQRMSAPPASLMYSWTMMFCLRPMNASITDSAAVAVSHSTTPMPWVPSSTLITSGAPLTISIRSGMSSGEWAKPVTGKPIPRRDSNCSERSLSRERAMATDSLSGNTPIISNWRSTAQP
ncbi:hypothetical protein D3C75_310070 [compost metagenome]